MTLSAEWIYRYDVQPLQMDTDFIRQLGPAMHIDLLNRERFRYPVVLPVFSFLFFSRVLLFCIELTDLYSDLLQSKKR